MVSNNIVHVLSGPVDRIETDLPNKVAAILGKDIYQTRLLLSGNIPKLIGHYPNTQEAELVASHLKALGLVVVVCSDGDLHKPPSPVFRAHRMRSINREVTFWDSGGQMVIMDQKDVFLILLGRIQIFRDIEATGTVMKFNLPATLLTGGIPVWRKSQEATRSTLIETGNFVRLYNRISVDPVVEIFENNFDFSSLGSKMTLSSFVNFSNVIAELKDSFPEALFDDRLIKTLETVTRVTNDHDLELNCKLIYLYHRELTGLQPL